MVQIRATEYTACFSPAATCVSFVSCWQIKVTEVIKSPLVYLGIRYAGSQPGPKAHLPSMHILCYQPYALWSRLPFPSTGPASDSQCLTAPDGPLRGLLELEWVGREGLRQEAERESPKVQSGRICCLGEGCSSLQVNWEL